MAYEEDKKLHNQNMTLKNPIKRLYRHMIPLRRRKMPIVHLGGKKPKPVVKKMWFRRIRLRWLKLKYMCMLRKLKEYYKNLVKELVEAGGSLETFQQSLLLETSFAVTVMGMHSFSSFPAAAGSDDRPTTFVM